MSICLSLPKRWKPAVPGEPPAACTHSAHRPALHHCTVYMYIQYIYGTTEEIPPGGICLIRVGSSPVIWPNALHLNTRQAVLLCDISWLIRPGFVGVIPQIFSCENKTRVCTPRQYKSTTNPPACLHAVWINSWEIIKPSGKRSTGVMYRKWCYGTIIFTACDEEKTRTCTWCVWGRFPSSPKPFFFLSHLGKL